MKLYRNKKLSVKCLRTGLFIVCFPAVLAVVSACGSSDDKLLSELRKDDLAPADSGTESVESGDSDEVSAGMTEESGVDGEAFPRSTDGEDTGDGFRGRKIYVHVCGAVKRPGVYGLPAGSRFYEAVEEAGGFTEDACEDYLNMAAPLADGSRLEIPTSEEIRAEGAEYRYYTLAQEKGGVSDGGDAAGGADASGELVNINTADIDRLCRLPGVGEGRAKAIIEYRNKQGGFQKKEDIMQVSGIGEKMYARMEEYLTVE